MREKNKYHDLLLQRSFCPSCERQTCTGAAREMGENAAVGNQMPFQTAAGTGGVGVGWHAGAWTPSGGKRFEIITREGESFPLNCSLGSADENQAGKLPPRLPVWALQTTSRPWRRQFCWKRPRDSLDLPQGGTLCPLQWKGDSECKRSCFILKLI